MKEYRRENKSVITKRDLIENLDVVIKIWSRYKDLYVEGADISKIKETIARAKEDIEIISESKIVVDRLFDYYISKIIDVDDAKAVYDDIDKLLNYLNAEKDVWEVGLGSLTFEELNEELK